jgi:hypothetical protein
MRNRSHWQKFTKTCGAAVVFGSFHVFYKLEFRYIYSLRFLYTTHNSTRFLQLYVTA